MRAFNEIMLFWYILLFMPKPWFQILTGKTGNTRPPTGPQSDSVNEKRIVAYL